LTKVFARRRIAEALREGDSIPDAEADDTPS
jgi:hypothetical protein